MTPAEWLLDALAHVADWNAQHASLDEYRASLPSDEAREALRLSGSSQLADQLDGLERGVADVMRDLDGQVKRTVADVRATVAAMSDADRAEARPKLRAWGHPLAVWALELLDAPRAARASLASPRALRPTARELATRAADLGPSSSSSSSALPLALGAAALLLVLARLRR